MTDRPMHSDPSPNLGPHLAAVERRLARRTPADPPAALRSRILMAVDDAAETVPATESYVAAGSIVDDDVRIPGWAWAAATVLGLVLTVPVVAGMEALRSSAPTLADRLRSAGLIDESLVAALAAPPRPAVAADRDWPAAPVEPPRPLSHARELRRLLEETL